MSAKRKTTRKAENGEDGPRALATATITFGLVTVPVRLYPTASVSGGLSFHMLHGKDRSRLKQQYVCVKEGTVVPRSEIVKGFEVSKGRFVVLTDEELRALDAQASRGIEIAEFVPEDSLSPVYIERHYYLGPDGGGAKAYALLADAMADEKLLAIARYAARGKDYLVALRSSKGRLIMHQLFHQDEVRAPAALPAARTHARPAEVELAKRLIESIASDRFAPSLYEDEVRKRVRRLIARKAKGLAIEAPEEERPRKAEVIDLMSALKASLQSKRGKAEARGRSDRSRRDRKAS